jgi:hypothetical protein
MPFRGRNRRSPSKKFYLLEITDPLAAELGAGAAYVRLID